MCYNGKCLHCIPVKSACLVLGIINAVSNGLVLVNYVFSFIGLMILLVERPGGSCNINLGFHDASDDDYQLYRWRTYFQIFIIPILALLNLFFSSVLCYGICNGKPKQVKIYFWYGVVFSMLAALASVMLMCLAMQYQQSLNWDSDGTNGVLWFIGCILHSLFLALVHETHRMVAEEAKLNDQVRLLENKELTYTEDLIIKARY